MIDQKLHDDMLLFARKVVEQAKECFEVALDYSEESLPEFNRILGYIYELNRTEPLEESKRVGTTMLFGAYLGEVFRRNVGGEWMNEDLTGSGEKFIFVRMNDQILMTIAIVYKIITEGPREDLNVRDLALDYKNFPHVQ